MEDLSEYFRELISLKNWINCIIKMIFIVDLTHSNFFNLLYELLLGKKTRKLEFALLIFHFIELLTFIITDSVIDKLLTGC